MKEQMRSFSNYFLTSLSVIMFSILLLSSFNVVSNISNYDNTALAFQPATKMRHFIAINPGATDPRSQNPYNSSQVTVPLGAKLTWINNDLMPHKIASGDPDKGPSNIFYSGVIQSGGSFNVTFSNPGVYPYYDLYYNHMRGKIMVVGNNTQ
jgi:plastocyanin